MRRIILTAVAVILLIVAGSAALIYAGAYDIAADRPSWSPVAWIVNQARLRSVRAHAAEIIVPDGLDDQAKIAEGAGHFAQDCAGCHGAPGMKRADAVAGLNPRSPGLTMVAKSYSPAELFWITKHGSKLSGMPAWIDHTDQQVWAVVAFSAKTAGHENAGVCGADRGERGCTGPAAARGGAGDRIGATAAPATARTALRAQAPALRASRGSRPQVILAAALLLGSAATARAAEGNVPVENASIAEVQQALDEFRITASALARAYL